MKTSILFALLAYCSISFAGSGHDHSQGHGHSHGHSHGQGHSHTHAAKSINEQQARDTGKSHIERLIKSEKIDASWSGATFEKAETKTYGKKNEWVVTFLNEKGMKGKKLYIFLSQSGDFVAANFTGK